MLDPYEDPIDSNIDQLRAALLDDLYFFMFYFFSRINNTIFLTPQPVGRQNHLISITTPIMAAVRADQVALPNLVLNINAPPRYTKTEIICHTIAWIYAHNPRANNIYASYKKTLSSEKTETVRAIINSRPYLTLFPKTRLSKSTFAKDRFKTTEGGQTIAVGVDGSGLGSGAGTMGPEPYGGCLFIDDPLKAQDANSKAMIEALIRLYSGTLVNRRNDPASTAIILIAQRISQVDLTEMLLYGYDGRALDIYQKSWQKNAVIIPALDAAENALWPEKHSKQYLLDLKKYDPYTFYSQMQQKPISDSNRIFNTDAILFLKEEPKILCTFVVVDTAETADEVNDASVFSMFGVYMATFRGQETGELALHWISCHETRKEPEELVEEFEYFYISCLRHKVKPDAVFIEKKSTGGMLLSFFRKRPGLIVVDIERSMRSDKRPSSGGKTYRFKMSAPYMARGYISMNQDCRHREMCINHLRQITFGGTQPHDDIADTLADGIRLALIDQVIYNNHSIKEKNSERDIIMSINRQSMTHESENEQ